jgi:hypothetical protein
VLRDDGMSYGDYVEQLTYLLFLKMADERTKPPYNQKSSVPEKYSWPAALIPCINKKERYFWTLTCQRPLAVTIQRSEISYLYGNREGMCLLKCKASICSRVFLPFRIQEPE